jgi:hypothetical protein
MVFKGVLDSEIIGSLLLSSSSLTSGPSSPELKSSILMKISSCWNQGHVVDSCSFVYIAPLF